MIKRLVQVSIASTGKFPFRRIRLGPVAVVITRIGSHHHVVLWLRRRGIWIMLAEYPNFNTLYRWISQYLANEV